MSRLSKVSWGRALGQTVGQRQQKGAQGEFPLPGSHLPRGEAVVALELPTTDKPVCSLWRSSLGIGVSTPWETRYEAGLGNRSKEAIPQTQLSHSSTIVTVAKQNELQFYYALRLLHYSRLNGLSRVGGTYICFGQSTTLTTQSEL